MLVERHLDLQTYLPGYVVPASLLIWSLSSYCCRPYARHVQRRQGTCSTLIGFATRGSRLFIDPVVDLRPTLRTTRNCLHRVVPHSVALYVRGHGPCRVYSLYVWTGTILIHGSNLGVKYTGVRLFMQCYLNGRYDKLLIGFDL